jgi:hypothetical protein
VKTFGKVCETHPELNGERYQRHCIACRKADMRAYEERNRNLRRSRKAEQYQANKEHKRSMLRAWRARNHERYLAMERDRRKVFRELNPGVLEAKDAERYAKRRVLRRAQNEAWKTANPERWRALKRAAYVVRERLLAAQPIAKTYSKQTAAVYEECPRGLHVDHIVPLNNEIVCGLHVPWNLQYLPPDDNIKKSNRWWPNMPGAQNVAS